MKVDQGLFGQDFADHFAVLGVMVGASPKDARKRYLRIARKLHPDSLRSAPEQEKQLASEALSKLVNPAYEVLSQEKSATEHTVVLRMKGQQLGRDLSQLTLRSPAARALVSANNLDYEYRTAVQALAADQYESLPDVADIIGQLSELNLVYVARTVDASTAVAAPASQAVARRAAAPPVPGAPAPPPPPPRRSRETIIDSYLERATVFEHSREYNRAILELREALKAYPDSALCHGRLAAIYIKVGQETMARVHTKRALAIQPDQEQALQVNQRLERKERQAQRGGSHAKNQSGGGLFGLFGKKK